MRYHKFPRALLEVEADELPRVVLPPVWMDPERSLDGLHGHYFVNTPTRGCGEAKPTVFLAGRGRVFRISFHPDRVEARSRNVCGRSTIADDLVARGELPRARPFQNAGVARLSTKWPWEQGDDVGLGAVNLANTALVPVRSKDEGGERQVLLAATYDGGRPLYVCPRTLETVGAPGSPSDWRASLFLDLPFGVVNTSAHPVWSESMGSLVTVQYGRDIPSILTGSLGLRHRRAPYLADAPIEPVSVWSTPWQFLAVYGLPGRAPSPWGIVPSLQVLVESGVEPTDVGDLLPASTARWSRDSPRGAWTVAAPVPLDPDGLEDLVRESKDGGPDVFERGLKRRGSIAATVPRRLMEDVRHLDHTTHVLSRTLEFARARVEELAQGFLEIVRCTDGVVSRARRIEDQHGNEVRIVDSVHQMGETRHFLVFADCRFKFDLDTILLDACEDVSDRDARLARRLLSRPLATTTDVYLVRKAELNESLPYGEPVTAHRVTVPHEIVHFFVDFDDDDGARITLTAVHQHAFDGAEFISESDLGPCNERVDRGVVGMFSSPMDVQEIGLYEIPFPLVHETLDPVAVYDGTSSEDAPPRDKTWATGIGTGPGILTVRKGTIEVPSRCTRTFWYDQGLLPELVTRHAYGLTTGYRDRTTADRGGAKSSLNELKAVIRTGGAPGGLIEVRREQVDGRPVLLGRRLVLPHGVVLLSPQWVPHETDAARGFIVAPVFRALRDDATWARGDEEPADTVRQRELWILDADDIERGPVARFDADALGWQYTIHTCWLDALPDRPSRLRQSERFEEIEPEQAQRPHLAHWGRVDERIRQELAGRYERHLQDGGHAASDED